MKFALSMSQHVLVFIYLRVESIGFCVLTTSVLYMLYLHTLGLFKFCLVIYWCKNVLYISMVITKYHIEENFNFSTCIYSNTVYILFLYWLFLFLVFYDSPHSMYYKWLLQIVNNSLNYTYNKCTTIIIHEARAFYRLL